MFPLSETRHSKDAVLVNLAAYSEFSRLVTPLMLLSADARRPNPKVIAILAVVFLCGSNFVRSQCENIWHVKPPAARRPGTSSTMASVSISRDPKGDLNLSEDQERTVNQVLDDFGKYYQNLEEQRDDGVEC